MLYTAELEFLKQGLKKMPRVPPGWPGVRAGEQNTREMVGVGCTGGLRPQRPAGSVPQPWCPMASKGVLVGKQRSACQRAWRRRVQGDGAKHVRALEHEGML